MEAPKPSNEVARMRALRDLDILDTPPEEAFDRITRLASDIMGAPIVLVSLVDEERQWFKSAVGLGASETPREFAFCAHSILGTDVMVVPDALADHRFSSNPLVTDSPDIRFYAGAPLILDEDLRIGTLCAIDTKAREFGASERRVLRDLASIVVDELRLRRIVHQQSESNTKLEEQAHELKVANQALQQFGHIASHDLRSPLKTIINMADVAMRSPAGSQKALRHIRSAAEDLEAMVTGYRRLSRLQCSSSEERWVSELVAEARKQTGEGTVVEVKNDTSIVCDAALMTQVFANLISNAARYASDASIVFDTSRNDGCTTIRANNQVDAPIPVDASIFAPFRRLTKESEGTGLGLAIVDRVIQLHGGTATASCESHTFSVELTLPS